MPLTTRTNLPREICQSTNSYTTDYGGTATIRTVTAVGANFE